jgi:hypothetical protein
MSRDKYPIITLCGSSRFKEAFYEAQKQLTLEGNIVFSLGFFSQADKDAWEGIGDEEIVKIKEMLKEIHRTKIDLSDSIYVINDDGYIGESTSEEIEYAKSNGKNVRYLYE